MKVYVVYSDERTVVEDTYGHDGPYTGRTISECDFTIKSIWKTGPKHPYHTELEVTEEIAIGSPVHVVTARYSDGGTFSMTHGLGQIMNVFVKYEDAETLKRQILDKSYSGPREWGGYFSRLEGVDIDLLPLGG